MQRDLDQKMLDLDGNEFTDKATLKSMCFNVLNNPVAGDESVALDKKMKQYALLQKIRAGGVVSLEAEEISFIKERAAKMPFTTIAFGRLCETLEQDYIAS